jgi:hypothetical protein
LFVASMHKWVVQQAHDDFASPAWFCMKAAVLYACLLTLMSACFLTKLSVIVRWQPVAEPGGGQQGPRPPLTPCKFVNPI